MRPSRRVIFPRGVLHQRPAQAPEREQQADPRAPPRAGGPADDPQPVNERKPIGIVQGVDADGFLINPASLEAIVPPWDALVAAIKSEHSRKTSFMPGFEALLSRGSLPKQQSFLEKARKRRARQFRTK